MAKLYLFSCIFFLTWGVQAQTIFKGQVLDNQTRQPLAGVSVSVNSGSSTSISDERGRFRLEISSAADTVLFSRVGYFPKKIVADSDLKENVVFLQITDATLAEVVVTGYETNRPLSKTAGAISYLTTRDFNRFNNNSLVSAFNTLPGVRMEERATASYRISIRGSSLRAPFGVRNVKIYLNDVPLVEANGTLPLNLLDAGTIGQAEVIKGPAGSVFGAGTGGTILLQTNKPLVGEGGISVQSQVGSFGLQRHSFTAATATDKSDLLVQYGKQKLDGYREHSAMDRDVVLVSGRFYPTDKQTFGFHGYYSDLFYELPGALTLAQYEDNPKQARQLNKDQNASINLKGVNIGLNHQYQFSPQWSNSTSLFGVFSFLNHPFTNDYERNANQAFGGRTKTTYSFRLGDITTRFSVGAEWQQSFVNSRHYENNKGIPGKLRFDDEVTGEQGFLFAQTEADLPGQFIVTLGGSINKTQYKLTRVTNASSGGNFNNTREFETQFSPRLGLVKIITPHISAHGSISYGFSPPTEAEIRPSDGSINTSLNPERGLNYETGIRGKFFKQKVTFDIVGFAFKLNETIVSRTNPAGVVVFANAGTTNQKGMETALAYKVIQAPTRTLSYLNIYSNFTYSHFRFGKYQQLDQDFSGNQLTGTPEKVLISGLDLVTKPGFYLNVTSNSTSKIPLNNANTVFAQKFLIFGARTGFKHTFKARWQADIYGGIDNATDEDYSLGNDLNGFGNRYFQTAPGRNFYTGVQLKYLLKAK